MGSETLISHRDKRDDRRFDCEGTITYSSFNKHDILKGKILNFSKNGMYFESDANLRPGTTIYFRLEKCTVFPSDPALCEGLRSKSLAEVRWCTKVNNQSERCFGTGVKYYKTWHFEFKNNQHSAKRE
jgi:hypothetical protein